MAEFGSPAALEGLAVEAVEWLPSGAESGLVRVRGRWIDPARREPDLPALVVRRGEETRRFESLPDARFGRDPAVWRATYLVPAALMDPQPDELSLSWESGARAGLPAPARGFEPPAIPASAPVPEPEGEVIGRAVLAERRARRAEAAERAQAQRAAEALKAVEVLELRSAELERRLEAVQSEPASVVEAARDRLLQAEPLPAADAAAPTSTAAPAESAPAPDSAAAALTEAVAEVKRLRFELGEQRQRLRQSEMLRAADAVALATYRQDAERARSLQAELTARERELAAALAAAEAAAREAAAVREQASEQVSLAAQRAATDAAAVRSRAAAELAAARTELEDTARELDAERAAHARTSATLASRERELSAIGADLTGVRTELATVRHDASERAGELERRLADLQAALEAERRAHGIAATERETAQAGLALAESARTAETVARAALDEELDRERAAIATLTAALEAAQAELTAAQTTQSDLVLSREQTRAELAAAQARAASAEAEVAAANERAAAAAATAQAEVAAGNERAEAMRGELAAANARAAAVRGELDAALDRAASAEAEVAAANERAAAVRGEVDAALGRAASAEAPAAGVREELAAAQAALAAARASIADLERRLETERGAAGREAGGLLARIAELERAGDNDLDRRAREQETAATAVPRPDGDDRRELTASFDAAAAALKARPADEPAEPASAPAPAAAVQPAPADEPAEPASTSPPAARPQPAPAPPAADRPARPRIVTEAKHPPRGDIVGSSKRQYPWLRGALVKLAHDDPRAATRLVLGLVPAQRALLQPPLEYDLTIRDSGTYAISITEQGASARSVGGPRSRDEAVFHASADIVTLTELLAGVEKRMGRWIGSVKVHGRRRHAEALRGALAGAGLDLAAAARAGADLEPDLVFRAFAYAIHPSWTKGHTFTVAQEIAGPRPLRWHVAVRDGRPISVERRAPAQPPDAVVSMTRLAFTHLLRGEQPPSGERPAIRGDGAAVAVLKSWTDRAQGRA